MVELFMYVIVICVGFLVGSFLNVVADRLLRDENFIKGRSRCDFCLTELVATDLVPVVSFVYLKGRCRYCKEKLSYYYPLAEISTAFLFALMAWYSGVVSYPTLDNFVEFIYLSIIMAVFVVISLTDFKEKLIPDGVVFFGMFVAFIFGILAVAFNYYSLQQLVSENVLGKYLIQAGYLEQQLTRMVMSLLYTYASTVGIFLFFYLLIIITKGRGMGGGDLKLSVLIGLFNGFPLNIIAIFMGFLFGALVSIFLVIFKVKSIKDTVPFGPFMVAGSIFTLIYGPKVLELIVSGF